MSRSRSAKGNIIERRDKCPDCGKEFDPESFRVKVKGSGPYLSYLCRECASKEPNVEIIEPS